MSAFSIVYVRDFRPSGYSVERLDEWYVIADVDDPGLLARKLAKSNAARTAAVSLHSVTGWLRVEQYDGSCHVRTLERVGGEWTDEHQAEGLDDLRSARDEEVLAQFGLPSPYRLGASYSRINRDAVAMLAVYLIWCAILLVELPLERALPAIIVFGILAAWFTRRYARG